MIRSGDNRQGVCPVKFLQEVWQRTEVACQADYSCFCTTLNPPPVLNKIYYPNPNITVRNNDIYYFKAANKKNLNSSNMFQYYYNNISNNLIKNNSYTKQINLNNNNKNFPNFHLNKDATPKFLQCKAPFSSSKRPLSIRLTTPKHVSNFFHKTFRSDSQKRPLLLNFGSTGSIGREYVGPNFQIIPKKTGLKISSIYTISEDVEKFSLKTPLYRKNLYISSNSRPLFVRK